MRQLDCRDPRTGEPLGNDGFTWAARGDGPRSAATGGDEGNVYRLTDEHRTVLEAMVAYEGALMGVLL